MKWTKDSPVEPGWYWWRVKRDDAEVIRVVTHDAGLRLQSEFYNDLVTKCAGEWAGPIPEPQETEDEHRQ